jgi:hypothetical protein
MSKRSSCATVTRCPRRGAWFEIGTVSRRSSPRWHWFRPRRWTALIAFLVSAGGFAAVLLYQYVNVGAIGPLPNMYDPFQYPEKTLSVSAEGIAAVAALALLALMHRRARGSRSTAATGAALHRGG